MSELVEFLRARLDEDEAWALTFGAIVAEVRGANGKVQHLDPRDRVRLLAEVDAKRRIVEHFTTATPEFWGEIAGVPLRALAAVYAAHPDYREEWRP